MSYLKNKKKQLYLSLEDDFTEKKLEESKSEYQNYLSGKEKEKSLE